jgi:SPP1 family predicted phage head-tail adaptor
MSGKMPDIGQFNRRVVAEKLSTTQDAGGGLQEMWTTVYTTWAAIKPLRSNRDLQQNQTALNNAYLVYIRFTPSHEVSKNIRFRYEGNILVVNSMQEVTEGRKRYWELILMEQV